MKENKNSIELAILNELQNILKKDIETFKRTEVLWTYFPSGSAKQEAPAVTVFHDFIVSRFEVILSEREWENPTIASLVDTILAKHLNIEKMFKSFEKHIGNMRKALYQTIIFFLIVGLIPLFTNGIRMWKFAIGLEAFLFLIVWGIWIFEKRKLKAEYALYNNYKFQNRS